MALLGTALLSLLLALGLGLSASLAMAAPADPAPAPAPGAKAPPAPGMGGDMRRAERCSAVGLAAWLRRCAPACRCRWARRPGRNRVRPGIRRAARSMGMPSMKSRSGFIQA